MARGCASCGSKPFGMAFRAKDDRDRARLGRSSDGGPGFGNSFGSAHPMAGYGPGGAYGGYIACGDPYAPFMGGVPYGTPANTLPPASLPCPINPNSYRECFNPPLCWGLHLTSLNDYKCEEQSNQLRTLCWGLKLFNGDYERRDLCYGLRLTP